MRTDLLSAALGVSTEDLANPDGTEINPVTAETVVEVDEVLEQVREAGDTMAAADSTIETLETAEASIESLITSLESSIAGGGLDHQAADMYSRGMANATRGLPIESSEYVPALESFGGVADKLVTSNEALDQAKALLAKIIAGIKNAWNTAVAAVKKFLARIFDAGVKLVAGGKSLKASANGITGDAGDAKVSGNSLLMNGGKFDAVGSLRAYVTAAAGVQKSTVDGGRAVEAQALKLVDGNYDKGAAAVAVANATFGPLPGTLPGGYVIKKVLGTEPKAMLNRGDTSAPGEQPAANKAEIIAIADQVINVGIWLQAFNKKYYKAQEDSVNKAIKYLETETRKAETDEAKASALKANGTHVNKLAQIAKGIGPQFNSVAASAAQAGLRFGSASIKAHKPVKAPAATAAA